MSVEALIDSGATSMFINIEFIRSKNIQTHQLPRAILVYNIDGTPNEVGHITQVVDLIVQYKDHSEQVTFHVMGIGRTMIIPGHMWLMEHNPDVLCHHSPRWISLTFGQHSLYSVGDPYICATALYGPCYSSLPSPTLLTSTFCFQPTFAYTQAKPPEPCYWLICNRHIYHAAHQEARPDPVVPSLLRQAVECGGN